MRMHIFPECPDPARPVVDWTALRAQYAAWLEPMHACPQDPEHHGEGDVGTHTRLVVEALLADPAWRGAAATDREVLFAAALLHDVAKPETTITGDQGRLTSPHHAPMGAIRARRILWELGAPFPLREQVCGLIRWHQRPFHLLNRPDAAREAHRMSQTARLDLLTTLARADLRGRVSQSAAATLELVELTAELYQEQGCYGAPRAFASDHARFRYFRVPGQDPAYVPYDDRWGDVVILAGLPGTGKDTWLRREAAGRPVVSLDELRAELGARPGQTPGRVLQVAYGQARTYLRGRTPFIWNATNLVRDLRAKLIRLLDDYGARVRIHYLEVPPAVLQAQNAARPARVPDLVLERMLARWDVPDGTEAHHVAYDVRAGGSPAQ